MDGNFVPSLTLGPANRARGAQRDVDQVTRAGANVVVTGSGIFSAPDHRSTILACANARTGRAHLTPADAVRQTTIAALVAPTW